MHRSLVLLGSLSLLTSPVVASAGDLTPFQAEDVKPVQAQPVRPARRAEQPRTVRADDVQPVRPADEPRAFHAGDVKPAGPADEPRAFHADDVQPVQPADEPRAFHADDVQPVQPADEPRAFHADDVQPVQPADEPRVFHADDVQPAGPADEPEQDRSGSLSPARSAAVRGGSSSADLEEFHADPVKRAPKPGVDPVTRPGPLQRELVGTWQLTVPSGSTTHRLLDGASVIDRTTSTVGAPMGVLRIAADGRFTFSRAGTQVAAGRVEEVRPRQGADANGRYWRVRDERQSFYVNVTGGRMTLFSVAGNSFIANGNRQ